MKRSCLPILALPILLVLSACRLQSSSADEPAWTGATVLVGIDGFRWDYREHTDTPALDALAEDGATASLRPPFPTKTFVSHHSIATGLYPDRHGVVGNSLYDPEFDARFSMGNAAAVSDGRWWGGEPIWITVEKADRISATYFWPASEAEIDGHRPTHWRPYNGSVSGPARVQQILDWLDLPLEERPSFLTLYFSEVDGAGHSHGPLADETMAAVRRVDGYVDLLVDGLAERELLDRVNLVVVSDHGMAQLSPDRVIFVDELIDVDEAGVLSLGQYVALWPDEEHIDEVFAQLDDAHPALEVYRKGSIPERFRIDGHRRTPPIVGVVDDGWSASTRGWAAARADAFSGGGHGHDNALESMLGVFIAAGPRIVAGQRLDIMESVDVYQLLAASLDIEPAPHEGNPNLVPLIIEPAGR